MALFDQSGFLTSRNLSLDELDKSRTTWALLEGVYSDHLARQYDLETIGQTVSNYLRRLRGAHSLKVRVKSPFRLMEKVVRKRLQGREIDKDNYTVEITDLVGVRVLHLTKEDWQQIHEFILQTFHLHEQPTAYYRKGDDEALKSAYAELGCRPDEHPKGYRSVHYLAEIQPTKQKQIIEIQTRTLIEEAWSQIDHQMRYSAPRGHEILDEFLLSFNRLCGHADEMGSQMIRLRRFVDSVDEAPSTLKELERQLTRPAVPPHSSPEAIEELVNMAGAFYPELVTKWHHAKAYGLYVKCKVHLKNLATALEMYASDNGGRYPTALTDLKAGSYIGPEEFMCPATQQPYRYVSPLPGHTGDSFELTCTGEAHKESAGGPNLPSYSSERGLID